MTDDVVPLLVLGAGQRCGSTLIQRLLCSHPKVRIWGEHVGQLSPVLAAGDRLRTWTQTDGQTGRNELADNGYQGFLANLTPERHIIDEACRSFVETLFAIPARAAGRPIWGFKEVRYGLPDVLSLCRLFPRLRVIQVVRDPRDILRSLADWERHPDWTRRNTELAMQDWRTVAGSFAGTKTPRDVSDLLLTVRYEDLTADPARWTALIAGHCHLDAGFLDQSVFDNRVHAAGPCGLVERDLQKWPALPAALRDLIDNPAIRGIAAAYGYDLS